MSIRHNLDYPAKGQSVDDSHEPHDITQLIVRWQRGDSGSEPLLFEAFYLRLRQVASDLLRNESPGAMSPTSLVHSAYLRMKRIDRIELVDRKHFIRLAARVMRQIVVDKAHRRQRRGLVDERASA